MYTVAKKERKTLMHYFYIVSVILFVIALLVVGFVMDKEDLESD